MSQNGIFSAAFSGGSDTVVQVRSQKAPDKTPVTTKIWTSRGPVRRSLIPIIILFCTQSTGPVDLDQGVPLCLMAALSGNHITVYTVIFAATHLSSALCFGARPLY
ncbi:hypothetical protein [Zobellella taiwanensis]|uniref:hypothetical protein n=1 Tax=Zobellella taiwanensis TaxID=347535 RepID=UPI001FEB689C|nr:hypothetical protein [Zobellella taiwanensis]